MSDETVNENTPEEEITDGVIASTEAGVEVEAPAAAAEDLELATEEAVAEPGEVRFDKLKKA